VYTTQEEIDHIMAEVKKIKLEEYKKLILINL